MNKKPLPNPKKPSEIENQLRQQLLEARGIKPVNIDSENDDWLITYADAITLMLAFFILLFSVSEINQEKFEAVNQSLNSELLHKKPEQVVNPLQDLESVLSSLLTEFNINPDLAIKLGDNGLKVELPGELLFASASTDIEQESVVLLEQIADKMKAFSLMNYQVEIEGHTDDEPIHTNRFPSNWELSSGRAITVLKIFMDRGFEQNKLKAIGYAETRPNVPNRDLQGRAIKENQSMNRRVEIKMMKTMGFEQTTDFSKQ